MNASSHVRSNFAVRMAAAALAAGVAAAPSPAGAQRAGGQPAAEASGPASSSRGAAKTEQFRDYYFYASRGACGGYVTSPYPTSVYGLGAPGARNLRYGDVEYGRLLTAIQRAEALPAEPAAVGTPSLVAPADASTTVGASTRRAGRYRVAETRVIDVIDRGVIVASNREEMRLRGARVASSASGSDTSRLHGRDAMKFIRDLAGDQTVTVLFEDPVRSPDGTLIATVLLRDGSSLARRLLETGAARFAPEDFAPDQDPSDLAAAQESARRARLGVWSRP